MATNRLKSLELHGYKTFASRTSFIFPGEITAIVGPNGSGKSNVADSIRWVLGEQSYSLLRGRKTEDMIFSGSEFRPRAGMASATITFDNQDGWLPIDFTDVAITRRAYRDGQNEYLLNGQKVRLKEISELLAQSGLAGRTYTIIGQGLVDAALSLRPEERRRFFEEAAGIQLYRRRREEAINRLGTTRRNLERVLDILSEIEPRLKSLEKQARRAQEHERITADLRLLLRDWYGYHWHRAQRDLSYAQETFKTQEGLLERARLRQSDGESELETLHEKIQELRVHLGGLHNQSSELHTERERISRNLAVFNERQRAYSDQKQTLGGDLARMEEEQRTYEVRLETIKTEKGQLKTQLAEARENSETADNELNDRQKVRAGIESLLSETRKKLAAREKYQVQQKAKDNELIGRRESLSKLLQKTSSELAGATSALEVVSSKVSTADEHYSQKVAEYQQLEENLQEHRDSQKKTEEELNQARSEASSLDVERTRLLTKIDVIEQSERSLSGFSQGPKYILEEAQKGRLQGVTQALSKLIEVPAAYETAIASVFGDSLQGVLLENDNDLDEALNLLAKGEKGRTVFFPLSKIQYSGNQIKVPTTDSDVFGSAVELIQYPESLSALMQLILHGVIVVRNRAVAMRLLEHDKPTAAREGCYVTLEGEMFWDNGKVVAGRDGKAAIISRSREKRELKTELEEIENRQSEALQKVSKFEGLIVTSKERDERLRAELSGINLAVTESAKSRQAAQLELEKILQRIEWQKNQLASVEEQIKQLEQDGKSLAKGMAENSGDIEVFNEKIRQAIRDLNGLPIGDLQSQSAHWRTNAAVAERALQDAERRLAEYQSEMETGQEQFGSKNNRIQQVGQALVSLEKERDTLRSEEQKLKVKIDALREEISPAEKELEGWDKKYNQLQKAQMATQQATSVADRNMSKAHIELTRQRERLDTLRGRIEEDFGLVEFEYVSDVSGPTPLPLDGMVEQLPIVQEIAPEIEEGINRQRTQLRRLGAINPEAQKEYDDVHERYFFLKGQVDDLKKADADLCQVISELDELMMQEFLKTFEVVAAEFRQMFTQLFGGGSARLVLTDAENLSDTGIDIEARLPGRREQGLALLSGGERSLTAVALVFSLLKVSPTPFCVLDEVDAMLDESNVGRFGAMLKDLSDNTQFIVVTHNRGTVQTSNVIYGVTMGRDSSSQVISLALDEVSEEMMGTR